MALIKCSDRTRRDNGCHCHGDKNLYWAHDTSVTTDKSGYNLKECAKCGATGRYVLINANEYTRQTKRGMAVRESDRHNKIGTNDTTTTDETPEAKDIDDSSHWLDDDMPEIPTAFVPAKPEVAAVPDSRIDSLTAIVIELSGQVATLTAQLNPAPIMPTIHHYALNDVIIDIKSRQHVMMVGPAGTGKSTIAKQAATVLKLEYYELSLNPGMTATAITGYMQATGEYVSTLFRQAYENGGVFHFDEFDNGHPSTLATTNAALAGDRMAFPDGMVMRHPDFVCVASANTFGRGADRQYVGRQQIDAATLDRFIVEEILIDEAMETHVAESFGYAHTTEVLAYVRGLRKNAEVNRMPVIVSPRASYGMCALLKAGKSWDATVAVRLRKGLSDSDWYKLTSGVYRPANV